MSSITKQCLVISSSEATKTQKQVVDSCKNADLIELRLDLIFPSHSLNTILQTCSALLSLSTKPVILTYPKTTHLNTQNYHKRLLSLARLHPYGIDLDVSVPESLKKKILEISPKIKVIRSLHANETDFKYQSISECYQLMKQMFDADFYKIALTTTSILSSLKLYEEALSLDKQLIFLCLGKHGTFSRILAPIRQNPINYAYFPGYPSSAEGQLSFRKLKLFNYYNLKSNASLYGLIGFPISASLGEVFHNSTFSLTNLNACYLNLPTTPETLPKIFPILRSIPFQGLSVTMPLKTLILSYVDNVSPFAKQINAANTLFFQNETITAYNTDGIGCLKALQKANISIFNEHIAILGFGGSGRAIAATLSKAGAKVTVFNRSTSSFSHVSQYYQLRTLPLTSLSKEKTHFSLIISTLPPEVDLSLPPTLPASFLDISSTSYLTPLAKEARKRGVSTLFGYDMFIEQAIEQLKIWLPQLSNTIPFDLIRKKIIKLLEVKGLKRP